MTIMGIGIIMGTTEFCRPADEKCHTHFQESIMQWNIRNIYSQIYTLKDFLSIRER
jgi:hypothetical protein